ncbi:MAG: dihydropteroate synthase [Candidatus Omnitrophota bacterium]
MRILDINRYSNLQSIMREIKVDPYGIKIMAPKALTFLIKINSVSNIAANILKQEMLSLGGDVAIAKEAITGKAKKTDCLLIGNLSQFRSLHSKLSFQPFGLAKLAQDIPTALSNYQKNNFDVDFGRFKLNFSPGRISIMGIVNLTPDSFSGDGLYKKPLAQILDFAQKLINDGADILDIGGESSRPGAKPVSVKEELSRTIPVIKALAKKIKIPISIDTCKPQVAKQALENGASLVNDITGLRNLKIAKVVADYDAGAIIMHMKGKPQTMQKKPLYSSLIGEIIEYLDKSINQAVCLGVNKEKIIIDPGIGFGKTPLNNLEILKDLKEFKILGRPILIGTSRKSFIGKILHAGIQERLYGTLATSMFAVGNGANILRVHDVKPIKEALKIIGRINKI